MQPPNSDKTGKASDWLLLFGDGYKYFYLPRRVLDRILDGVLDK